MVQSWFAIFSLLLKQATKKSSKNLLHGRHSRQLIVRYLSLCTFPQGVLVPCATLPVKSHYTLPRLSLRHTSALCQQQQTPHSPAVSSAEWKYFSAQRISFVWETVAAVTYKSWVDDFCLLFFNFKPFLCFNFFYFMSGLIGAHLFKIAQWQSCLSSSK